MAIRVGKLWVNDNKATGEKYISGLTGPVIIPPNAKIAIRKNVDKNPQSNAPDFFLDIVEERSGGKVDASSILGGGDSPKAREESVEIPF